MILFCALLRRFICNWLYFRSLAAGHNQQAQGRDVCSLFVHVPSFAAIPEITQRQFLIDLLAELIRTPASIEAPTLPETTQPMR